MKRLLILCLAITISTCTEVQAQSMQTSNRSFVMLPGALGMGDAIVALPTQQSAFFYNPAHAAHSKKHVTIAGIRMSVSDQVFKQASFFRNDLQPAIDDGIDNLSSQELKELYTETLSIGRQTSFANIDALAPSVGLRFGPIGAGLGIYGASQVAYQFPDGGGGLPIVQMTGYADAMVVGTGAINLSKFGVSGLSAGLTAKYTHRFAVLKSKPLDAISTDEPFDVLEANRTSVDFGLMYELPLVKKIPGKVQVGLAIYDIVGSDFSFVHNQTLQGTSNQTDIDRDIETANALYKINTSFRLGVGYTLPKLPLGLLDETGFSIDYVGTDNPTVDQAFFAHLRVGAQARLKMLSVRAGLNQGYPTLGAGVSLGFIDFDYAYYGTEQGRYPGQLPSWHHTAQMRIGL